MQRAAAQPGKYVLDGKGRRHWHARVMPTKRVQPMRVGGGNQWFAKPGCYSSRPAIRIEQANVKMTELDRVKTIDFRHKPRPD